MIGTKIVLEPYDEGMFDEFWGAAPRAGPVGVLARPLACREIEKLRVYQRLERPQGPALLSSCHLREELPCQLGEHVFHCDLHLL